MGVLSSRLHLVLRLTTHGFLFPLLRFISALMTLMAILTGGQPYERRRVVNIILTWILEKEAVKRCVMTQKDLVLAVFEFLVLLQKS